MSIMSLWYALPNRFVKISHFISSVLPGLNKNEWHIEG